MIVLYFAKSAAEVNGVLGKDAGASLGSQISTLNPYSWPHCSTSAAVSGMWSWRNPLLAEKYSTRNFAFGKSVEPDDGATAGIGSGPGTRVTLTPVGGSAGRVPLTWSTRYRS